MSAREHFTRTLAQIGVLKPELEQFLAMFDRFYPETSEADRTVKPVQRFVFDSDCDGHRFMVPVELEEDFQKWADEDPYAEGFEYDKYSQYRIDGHRFSFTDPRQDV